MKKCSLIVILLFFCGRLLADDAVPSPETKTAKAKEETKIVYDVYKHMDNSSYAFLGIAGLSIGMGAGIIANAGNNQMTMGIGVGNLVWGLVESGLYLYDRNFIIREQNEKKAREKFAEMSGWHSLFDIGYVVAGGLMATSNNNYLKGLGMAAMIQGGILAVYDGVNFFIAGNPQDVKDWGAGIKFNIKLADSK